MHPFVMYNSHDTGEKNCGIFCSTYVIKMKSYQGLMGEVFILLTWGYKFIYFLKTRLKQKIRMLYNEFMYFTNFYVA